MQNQLKNLNYIVIGMIVATIINYYWTMPPRDWDYIMKDNDMLWASEIEHNYSETNKVIWNEIRRLDDAIEIIEYNNIKKEDKIAKEVLAIIIETIDE